MQYRINRLQLVVVFLTVVLLVAALAYPPWVGASIEMTTIGDTAVYSPVRESFAGWASYAERIDKYGRVELGLLLFEWAAIVAIGLVSFLSVRSKTLETRG